ncbi:type II secretion system protein [Butyrivibrio sp. FCS006]|uniref:type II secretion system protein n=1 Tax=Butyrivibrio sp. FCS006 TaxID=1280684 RepID=UPI0004298A8F|nr:type II secretion system protein [Butyrivibrio sp. FCS006]
MNRGIRFFTGTKRKKAGFSLAEVLVVIVILGILAAVGGVSAVSMYKNMKQTQLDKTAETIFHAAQDRLSELYAYGKEDTIENGGTPVTGFADKKVFYIKSGVSSEANTAIMGDDTVNGDVFANYWVIEYQASTCRVLNVVYADKNDTGLGGFGRGINETTAIGTLENAIINHAFSIDDRRNKFGWYGETDIKPLLSANKQVGNTSVDVDIINEENLYAHVRVSVGWEDSLTEDKIQKFLENVSIQLKLKDADTGAEYVYPSIPADKLLSGPGLNNTPEGFYNGKSDADGGATDYVSAKYISASWDVLLDSLYDDAFDSGSKSRYVPAVTLGHDFYLIAKLEGAKGITPTVQDYDIDNSLFAAASGTKAYIEYGRHLQNVGKAEVSGLNAIQIADINFNAKAPDGVTRDNDLDKFNKFWLSVYDDVGGFTNFKPTDSSYLASYDGQNHLIKNLDINQVNGTSDSGILGTLSYADTVVSVKNVIITDSTISSTSGAGKAGMFAANVTASNGVTLENCYLNKVTIDGSNTASLGGFIGEATSDVTAENCSFAAVKVGTDVSPAVSGSFIGKISAGLEGKNLSVLGGSVRATSNSGGIIGSSDADSKDITLKGCKVLGTEVAASNGNAGGIAGNVKNAQITISEDTAVASGIVRSSSGNAGGFIGNADAVINIKDSEYFIPSSAESDKDACSVKTEFVKTMGLSANTPNAILKYVHLKDKFEFKYIEDLKADDVVSKRTIVGYGNVGGLVGASTKNITIENTFSAGVLSAATNAGGFVGSTTGKLSVNSSYSDFYISGKNVGGFAAACNSSSEFHSCYTAGFLTSTADTAAGFAPVEIGDVSDSYSVFNFDNVCDFSGKAGQDSDHNVNVNGTVNNYPDVNAHNNCYPIAPKSKGVAYYVYTATTFTESANAVAVTSTELAENTKTGGGTLLGGNFVTGTDSGSTYPYSLSSFLDTTLVDYPFPKLNVSKVTVVDSSPTDNVKLGHYNDWLTFDGKNDIEIWYMMYDENLKELRTDVRFARKTKAVPVTTASGTEYQINVGSHSSFSGYKFVGYYDPDTAYKVGSTSFDRAKKLDYLAKTDDALLDSVKSTMKTGDRVVQTSINGTNTFGETCSTHSSIFRADSNGTKKMYAVYRFNKPYSVRLSYIEYVLPAKNATSESKTLRQIYTGSKVASTDEFQVAYKEPSDGCDVIYSNQPDIREKVRASHSKLAHDEELIEDYIAEKILSDETLLRQLDEKRAAANKVITREIPNFKSAGFELLDLQALYQNRVITRAYRDNVLQKPVYTIVRIGPEKDSDGNTVPFENRGCTEVTKDSDNKISMSTYKAFDYVILYNSDYANRRLNLVFENTKQNESSTIPVVNNYESFSESLAAREISTDASKKYTVRVGDEGFTDIEGSTLVKLMDEKTAPTFAGFTKSKTDAGYVNGVYTVTHYYQRNKYKIYFGLNWPQRLTPPEKYNGSEARAPKTDIYYGQTYHDTLWEDKKTDVEISITGPNINALKGSNEIWLGTRNYGGGWSYNRRFYSYEEVQTYIKNNLSGNTGSIRLRIGSGYFSSANDYNWYKTDVISYAFTREGFILTGFKYYYQSDTGTVQYDDKKFREAGETNSVEEILTMPDRDVLVVPIWTENPLTLRVEIYYQSAYDNINASTKQYELYKGTTFGVNNGIASGAVDAQGNTLKVTDLIMKSSDTSFVDYLEPFVKNNCFDIKDDHNIEKQYPYEANKANSARYGKPHFDGSNAMVVALYYDRIEVEYRFHFITDTDNSVTSNRVLDQVLIDGPNMNNLRNSDNIYRRSNNGYQYYVGDYDDLITYIANNTSGNSGTIYLKLSYYGNNFTAYTWTKTYINSRVVTHHDDADWSQWDDFHKYSTLDDISADDESAPADKKAFSMALNSTSSMSDFVPVGNHAKVKVVFGDHKAVNGTSVDYVEYTGSRGYAFRNNITDTSKVNYGVIVYIRGLYGAPAVFSSDGSNLMPTWFYYTSLSDSEPFELQEYRLGGTSGTSYTEFSLRLFQDINKDLADYDRKGKDLYPNYLNNVNGSGTSIGFTEFYTEITPGDDAWSTATKKRTNANTPDDFGSDYFNDLPIINNYGRTTNTNTYFITNDAMRIFVEGYTTYYILNYNDEYSYHAYNENNIPEYTGYGYLNQYVWLKRNTFTLDFVDATLKNGVNFTTDYLYKQEIPRLPRGIRVTEGTQVLEPEITAPSDDYIFDGWYASSAHDPATKIAEADGTICESYKQLASTLVDSNNNLLMNCQNLQAFAYWAPKECNIQFNPFYPDVTNNKVDTELICNPNPVPYKTTITSLPEKPRDLDENRIMVKEGDDYFYVIKNDAGDVVKKYKFLGWYLYSGLNEPTDMSDLTEQVIAGQTEIINHSTLYGKWQLIVGNPTYTIICSDYTSGNEEIFSVIRSGNPGESITINPPISTDDRSKDIRILSGSYENLKNYEALSNPVQVTIIDGMTLRFRYKEASAWQYIVNNCINIDGQDIIISSYQVDDVTYARALVAPTDIPGYSIYEYQIDTDTTTIADTSDYIPVNRPENSADAVTITVRYKLKPNVIIARSGSINYYKYDPIDWITYVSEDVSNSFKWADETYGPAIIYNVNGVTTSTFLDNDASDAAAIEAIAAIAPGTYPVTMQLVAMKRNDTSSYMPIKVSVNADDETTSDVDVVVQTSVTINKSAYALKFVGSTEENDGFIYYKFAGKEGTTGLWYWDEELKYEIGADGTSIVTYDISTLPTGIQKNAQNVQNIIEATKDIDTGKYKFFFIVNGTEAFIVVDSDGILGNGNKLNNDLVAYVEASSGTTKYIIKLYNVNGEETGTIEVWI